MEVSIPPPGCTAPTFTTYNSVDDVVIRWTLGKVSVTFFVRFLLLQVFILMNTSVFYEKVVVEIKDLIARGIICSVLNRAFS